MLEILILLVAPSVTSWVVDLTKRLYSIRFSPNKKLYLRSLAAVLSFGGVFAASLADGEPMSPAMIEEAVTAVLVFGASQIPYFYGKLKARNGV